MTRSIVNEEPATPLTVPRFVRALNRVAESAGFSTDVHVGNIWVHDSGPYLISTWRGSPEAFSRLKFLPKSEHVRIHTPGGKLQWPCGPTALLYGTMGFAANAVEFRLQAEIPKAVRVAGEIEQIDYHDRTAYHGTRAALIAAGVCSDSQFPGKRNIKRCAENWGEAAKRTHWSTQRQLDGLYVHSVETTVSKGRRIAELAQYAYDSAEADRQAHEDSAPSGGQSLQVMASGNLVDIRGIEQYRRRILATAIEIGLFRDPDTRLFDQSRSLKSLDGYIYRLEDASAEGILDAIRELRGALHNAEIRRIRFDNRTLEERTAARDLLARAEGDGAFQAFLGRLQPPGQP